MRAVNLLVGLIQAFGCGVCSAVVFTTPAAGSPVVYAGVLVAGVVCGGRAGENVGRALFGSAKDQRWT